ncbi:hypothetical protein Ahy_B04g071955 [Arachis hypogaea]|uniref:Uncharacterized protein n=1 Tax=Arachis hypogaea TaxID=3818 RepID=A0A444ZM14_ARAHY|nr:hypothetical protein Ahy_B04g071955 [Arachis hypogaea]
MMAPNKTSEVVDTHEATWSSQTDDLELESLESELKQMAHKILEHRSTLPDQLKSTLLSILDAHRPLYPHPSHHASTPPERWLMISRNLLSFLNYETGNTTNK